MTQYVLANRRAGKFNTDAKGRSRAAVASALVQLQGNIQVSADNDPADALARRVVVFDADANHIENIRRTLAPDAILEPVMRRSVQLRVPIEIAPILPEDTAALAATAASTAYSVSITSAGKALSGIDVMFYVRDPGGHVRISTAKTDAQGHAQVNMQPGYIVMFVEPLPYAGAWIMFADAPPSGTAIDCLPIPKPSADGTGWWHDAMGIDGKAANRGAGIKVGVIDTGCGPHPNLAQVHLVGYYYDGQVHPASQARDVAEHGTHTTGIIGAQRAKPTDYQGMAPACDLYHARVFQSEEMGPSQADIVNAVDALSRTNGCDLINMSLGGPGKSEIEEDAIKDAAQRGTLCICSAGNSAGAIMYPAAFPECVSVSAIGKVGWAPAGTFSATNRPKESSMMGLDNYFLASFSCYGSTLSCTGPGVGIVSTVPDRHGVKGAYMEMDGTSMASPAVCGALTVILSNDASYRKLPRDQSRATAARNALAKHCVTIGLDAKYEGRGLPQL